MIRVHPFWDTLHHMFQHIGACGNPSVFQEFGMCTEHVCLLSLCCFSFIVLMMSLHLGSKPLSLSVACV